MSNPWFKMWAEFAHDPKVQSMSEAMQRRLVMLFCLETSVTLRALHVTELRYALQITDEEMAETKALFMQKKFIDEGWNLLHWEKRQSAAKSGAERVRAHREKKKSGVTKGNVTETLHVQQETEAELEYSDTNVSSETDVPPSEKSPPEIDFKKIIFTDGLNWLAQRTGKPPNSLRSLVGKWCKHGDHAVAAAIIQAQKESAIEPIAFIEKILRGSHETHHRNQSGNHAGGNPAKATGNRSGWIEEGERLAAQYLAQDADRPQRE